MATQKPSKPNVTLPESFGGTKYELSDDLIRDGYPETVPTIVDGGNINWEKDAVFKNNKYLRAVADTLVDMPIGKILTVDSNNRFEYANPTVIANDSEYEEGTLTTKSPSVKQVRDSFADLDGRITNCLTAIPQDIKLELNNGTLTLKAGSKVCYLDGSSKIIQQDITTSTVSATPAQRFLWVNGDSNFGDGSSLECYSGNNEAMSDIVSPKAYQTFYNTEQKKAFRGNGTNWKEQDYSLPIALVSNESNVWTSIDQVFNGFGYIGSTIFVLPGVEGLIPNGFVGKNRNNIKLTLTNVHTYNIRNSGNLYLGGNTSGAFTSFEGPDYTVYYIYDKNQTVYQNVPKLWLQFATATFENGRITSFNPKTIFQAPDYYDVPKLATDNTFTGENQFMGNNAKLLTIKNPEMDLVNGVSSEYTASLRVLDKNDKAVGDFFVGQNSSYAFAQVVAYNSSGQYCNIAARIAKDGAKTTVAPTPPTTDNSTQIATTAWVNNFFNTAGKVTGKCVPNYGAGVGIGTGTTVIPKDSVLIITPSQPNFASLYVTVNGVNVFSYNGDEYLTLYKVPILVPARATVVITGNLSNATYYPFVGA